MLGLQLLRTSRDAQHQAKQHQLVDVAIEPRNVQEFWATLASIQHQQEQTHHKHIDQMRYNREFDVAGPSGAGTWLL